MSSWRDDASERTQADLDEVLDVSIRAAQERLDDVGEFYPFGVALADPGRTHLVTPEVKTGPREIADPTAVLALCWDGLREQAETLSAVSVVTNVGGADGDAIAVALEHRDGPAIEVFLPYVTQGKTAGKRPAQKHLYGVVQAVAGSPRVWA
jgi:hypothetical protein